LIHRILVTLAFCTLGLQWAPAGSTNVYKTGFEASEGFQEQPLAGQNGWVQDGTGGAGITGPSTNQYAYIGFNLPTSDSELSTAVWKPLSVSTVPSNSVLAVRVDLSITDTSAPSTNYDEFHWSVYNTNNNRLFSLIFDNNTLGIFYQTSDGVFGDTGFSFDHDIWYHLVITLDFARNRWNAVMNQTDLGINRPIVSGTIPLNFGDADAIWSYSDPFSPGDNYMSFDDFQVSIDSSSKPLLQSFLNAGRRFRLRVNGDEDFRYAVEATTSFSALNWLSITTNTVTGGYFEFLDPLPPSAPTQRFYRARWVR